MESQEFRLILKEEIKSVLMNIMRSYLNILERL